MPFEFEFVSEGLPEAIQNLPQAAQDAIIKTVADTRDRAVKIAKFKTPVDTGTALDGWKVVEEEGGLRAIFLNNVPYINVLEFGSYPVRPLATSRGPATLLRGDAVLGGLPPRARTQRAPGGTPVMRSNVSKQAPRGMVRSTLEEIEDQFLFDLSENLDEALA